MPPKGMFFRNRAKGSQKGGQKGGQKGIQQSITNFVVASPSKPAAASPSPAAAAEEPRPAKRQRTGNSGHVGAAGSPSGEASEQLHEGSQEQQQQQQGEEEGQSLQAAAPSTGAPRRPVSTASKTPADRATLQRRLLGSGPSEAGGSAAAAAAAPIEPYAGGSAPQQKLTPLEQQIVDLKRKHPGVMLIVEIGYKAKLFGEDAVVASRVLRTYTWQDRNFLTTWVPVERLHVHIRKLVMAGHKVGVVRQVETAAIKKAGDNKSGVFERRMTALHTRATLEAGELGGEEEDSPSEGEEGAAAAAAAGGGIARTRRTASSRQPGSTPGSSNFLVACVEEPAGGGAAHAVDVGLVAVEPSTGAVLYAQFRDGLMRQELESKLLFAAPAELLLAEPASTETRRLLAHIGEQLGGAATRLESAEGGRYRREGTALEAVEAFYGGGSGGSGSASQAAGGASATAGSAAPAGALEAVRRLPPLVLRGLAHLLDHLKPFGLEAVLRLGASFQEWTAAAEMRLSANTLRWVGGRAEKRGQLEIFQNSSNGGEKGSLMWVLDHTQTAFGRRLLRSWVGKPLRHRPAILARLDAVQELAEQGGSHPVLSQLRPVLKKLPDAERGLMRAYHRTSRPSEFAALLQQFVRLPQALGVGAELQAAVDEGVVTAQAAGAAGTAGCESGDDGAGGAEGGEAVGAAGTGAPQQALNLQGVQSALLRQLLGAAADPSVAAAAQEMLGSLDLQAAEKNDKLHVLKDSERFPEMQRWRGEVAAAEKALADLLPSYRRQLQISSLQFMSLHNVGDYLVEVPTELVKRVPKDWQKINAVKKGVRFRPPEVVAGLQRLELAREHLAAACTRAWQQFLGDFGGRYLPFRGAVQALAALDCLCSLAVLASSHGYTRPEFVEDGEPPQLHIEAVCGGGRHPVVELLLEERREQYVPNDTHLQASGHPCTGLARTVQGDGRQCQVITGPNMGGKSCYTRQVAAKLDPKQCALIAIMAQVGSYVPATAARLRALDGVYTRMGASDNLALGRSTFAEELGETSAILSAATPSSLVILDELGRGTSTGDGAAIAEATLSYLVRCTQPLTLFITHYPEVCFRLQAALPEAVGCYRMAHVEEEEGEEQGADQQQQRQEGGSTAAAAAASEAQPSSMATAGDSGSLDQQEHEQQGQQQEWARERRAALHAHGKVVFLFKLVEGVAPASFGLNVARMAQLPGSVLQRAAAVAARVQAEAEQRQQQQQQQQQPEGSAAGAGDGAAALADECRQWVQRCLESGAGMDVAAGRQLQQRARQLLALPS
ncbi:hypothetical protein COHA_007691 [Chlorella ohadii]|uniref:DNA mismatch repair protein n=1 Tax=Chlorella ohadii TaxID=2649997 RepID=A0AAD5H2D2_9CHLO|nr:hypothetical protein COHA_007691 [Chlorella ohadii]